MNNVIYRFPVCDLIEDVTGHSFNVTMPIGANVLSVGVQFKTRIVVWAEVFDGAKLETKEFWVTPTGGQTPPLSFKFMGTVQLYDGAIVMHVYRKLP